MMQTTKAKYITNRELLEEIHKSKVSYCSFTDRRHADYDAIVKNLDAINPKTIETILTGKKLRPDITSKYDLVFRIMTYEHIPIDPDRKKRAKNSAAGDHFKVNFPPFKHYMIGPDDKLVEVCRSHWDGDFETGTFSPHKGQMTRRLAEMFMLLVERYSTRGNWRAYSYLSEMRGLALLQLSQVGLQFDESKSDNPFAFYTTAVRNCLGGETKILTREHGSVAIEEVAGEQVTLLDGNGDWVKCRIFDFGVQETQLTHFHHGYNKVSIWSTLDHGWMSEGERINTRELGTRKEIKVDDLRPNKIVNDKASYEKGIVHGMIYGDGTRISPTKFEIRICSHHESYERHLAKYRRNYYPSDNGDPRYYIDDELDDLKAFPEDPGDNLDYLLGFLRGWFSADGCVSTQPEATICGDAAEHAWIAKWGPLVGWHTNGCTKLAEETNYGKRNKVSLNIRLRASSMTDDDFLIDQHRERWQTRPPFVTINRKYDWVVIEAQRADGVPWQTIADMLGVRKNSLMSSYSQYRSRRKEAMENPSKKEWRVYRDKQEPEKKLQRVYCPYVETTNSFALADGIHSSNCFVRHLNLEKKAQAIRDELLIMSGTSPSFSRQVENEMEQRAIQSKE